MSNIHTTNPPGGTGQPETAAGRSTTDTAKDQAAKVGKSSAYAAKKVTGTAKDQAREVAGEAKSQVKNLYHTTTSELREQADVQQRRVASGLHSVSDELSSMASRSENPGIATDLVGQAASRSSDVADWLDQRDPGSLLEDVRNFARRRPGVFIGIAAIVGVAAGRLTRSMASDASDHREQEARIDRATAPAPATPPTPAPATGLHADSSYVDDVSPTPTADSIRQPGYGTGGRA